MIYSSEIRFEEDPVLIINQHLENTFSQAHH